MMRNRSMLLQQDRTALERKILRHKHAPITRICLRVDDRRPLIKLIGHVLMIDSYLVGALK
jgi:hypothetical protein